MVGVLPEFGVSEFIAVVNQTLELTTAGVSVVGELANFRVSRGKWVYFDLKDDESILKCFGSVFQLPWPLEDGMLLRVRGQGRLHPKFGFSFNFFQISPVGEGSIKKVASLLEEKLRAEGLFDDSRKRALPYPPTRIGLITAVQSAAYIDFMKILASRFGGIEIVASDVKVQGEAAADQIVKAISRFNELPNPPEVLVITRGGGSAEDLAAFNDEKVVRAVAASRVPTLVAIGHEIDVSLAELAADKRASTPSNAAELLVPDKTDILARLKDYANQLYRLVEIQIQNNRSWLELNSEQLSDYVQNLRQRLNDSLASKRQLLLALDPAVPLKRGYAIVRSPDGSLIKKSADIGDDAKILVEISDAQLSAKVEKIDAKN
jgi:exodeoxyribonuclease VII large subunit